MSERQYAPRQDPCTVALVGRIGTVRYRGEDGKTPVLNVSVANSRIRGDRENMSEETSWIPVVVFGNQAKGLYEKIGEEGLKGSLVAVEGRLQAGQTQRVKTVGNGEREFNLTQLEVVAHGRGGFNLIGGRSNGASDSSSSEPEQAEQAPDNDEDVPF